MEVRSVCAHCLQTVTLTIDSEICANVPEGNDPLVFVPDVNFFELEEPSIIEVF